MEPAERKVTFPIMGRKNSEVIKTFLESLELNVIVPPPTTDRTIELGVKYCANMVCYPLKVTLGNYIEALEKGANTLLAYDSQGQCRFRQYNLLHKFILTDLGYDFEMHVVNPLNLISVLNRISGKGKLTILKKIKEHYHQLKENDNKLQIWSEDRPNIGIIGEVFCCCDEKTNQGLEDKIRGFGGNPYNTITTTQFIDETIPLFNLFGLKKLKENRRRKKYKEQVDMYLKGFNAGHCASNLFNLLLLADKGVDGIIHVLPLSCMPETAIEPYINSICRRNKIPLLRIPIDENSAEANLETRLETFIELIKLRKKKDG